MRAERIDDVTLLVPLRAEGTDGEVGDALVEITRDDDPDLYDRWADWIDAPPREPVRRRDDV